MPSALKGRLQKLVDPLAAACYDRQAQWLEGLPADEVPQGIFALVFGGDRELMLKHEPEFVGKSDEEIAAVFLENAPRFIKHLREQARERRGRK